jgi:glucose-1-phosphate thymidylyltransferase
VTIHAPVHVEDGVELEDAEIGPNVTLGAGTKVRGSKLRDCIVGANAVVEGCDLHASLIGDYVKVTGVTGSVDLGDHSVVAGG